MSFSSALPEGAKLWLLDLGQLDMDAANLLAGANQFPAHLPPQPHTRRELIMISLLLYYPGFGLILFDTGSAEDVIASWGQKAVECQPRIWSKEKNGLPEAIKATGAGTIKDVKMIVMSHLHCDHAGGLEHFMDTDVEVWCHEEELKTAFWSYATNIDRGAYVKEYLDVTRLKWKTFSSSLYEFLPGLVFHHVPGHTPGSVAIEMRLKMTGVVIFTGDAFHVKENYEDGIHPGTLTKNFHDWHRSREYIRGLARSKNAIVILGHEPEYFKRLVTSPGCSE